jgi:hypothetical protein
MSRIIELRLVLHVKIAERTTILSLAWDYCMSVRTPIFLLRLLRR